MKEYHFTKSFANYSARQLLNISEDSPHSYHKLFISRIYSDGTLLSLFDIFSSMNNEISDASYRTDISFIGFTLCVYMNCVCLFYVIHK